MNRILLPYRLLPVLIVALAATYYALESSVYGQAAKVLAGFLCPAAVVLGSRMFRPKDQLVWRLVLLGQSAWLGAALLNSYSELSHRNVELNLGGQALSYSTICMLIGYLFFAAAMGAVQVCRDEYDQRSGLVDAGLVLVGLGVVTLTLNAEPALYQPLSLNARVEAIAFPFADIALVAGIARVFTAPGTRGRTLRLILVGCTLIVGTDTLEQALRVHQVHNTGLEIVSAVVWYSALIMIAMAPLHPSMSDLATRPVTQQRLSRRRLVLLAAALLCPWLVLIGQLVTASTVSVIPIVIAAGLQSWLVSLRMRGLMAAMWDRSAALDRAARTDHLTGLPNRRGADEALEQAMIRGQGCLALLDIDHFKRVNDELGHAAGDALLVDAARIWQETLDLARIDGAVLARYGGEEFLLILPGVKDDFADALLAALRDATPRGESFSAGLAQWHPGQTGERILRLADDTLYTAKEQGRARTVTAKAGVQPLNSSGLGPVRESRFNPVNADS